MEVPKSIKDKTPQQFVNEDVSLPRSQKRFREFRISRQNAKISTFLLGHNTECFAAEPVYGPTGKGFLKSRGVEGLLHDREILEYLASPEGKTYLKKFREQTLQILSEGHD